MTAKRLNAYSPLVTIFVIFSRPVEHVFFSDTLLGGFDPSLAPPIDPRRLLDFPIALYVLPLLYLLVGFIFFFLYSHFPLWNGSLSRSILV